MENFFNILIYLMGALFLLMGLQWLIDPTSAAAGLGMSLLSGHGLSTKLEILQVSFLLLVFLLYVRLLKRIKFGYIRQLPY